MSERFQRSRYPLSERLIQGAGSRLARSGGGGFSYDQLSETYPTLDVRRATAPRYVQEELDERDLILKEREAIVARRQADLQILDTQINQQRAMYEQIPMARQAIAELDPMDDDFLTQFIAIQNENPLAFEDDAFYKNVASPLLRRHEMLQQNKLIMQRGAKPQEKDIVTENELINAGTVLSNVTTQNKAKKGDLGAQVQIEGANEIIRRWKQQQDMQQQQAAQSQTVIPSGSPIPSAYPVPSATPQTQSRGVKALDEFYIGR